jgi:hypothetical protein
METKVILKKYFFYIKIFFILKDNMKHVIIGGGIAGLYIGYQLYKKGEDFIILEKNPDINRGRLYSIISKPGTEYNQVENLIFTSTVNNNFVIEMGASVIHENQKLINELIKELNLEDSLEPISNKTKTYFIHPKLKNKEAKQKWREIKQNVFNNISHLPPDYTLEEAAKKILNKEEFETFKSGTMEWFELNLQNARTVKKAQNEEGQYYMFKKGTEEIVKVLTEKLKKYIHFDHQVDSIKRITGPITSGLRVQALVENSLSSKDRITDNQTSDKYKIEGKEKNNKIFNIECNKVYLCTDYTCAKNYIKYYNIPYISEYLNLGFDRCCYRFYVYFRRPVNIEYGYIYGDFELKWSIKINPQLWMITYVDGPLSCKLNGYKEELLIRKWINMVNRVFGETLNMNDIVFWQGAFWKDAYTVLNKNFYSLVKDPRSLVNVSQNIPSTPRQNKYKGEIIRESLPGSFVCTVLPKDVGENTAWMEAHLFKI